MNFNHFSYTRAHLDPRTFEELLLALLRRNCALQVAHNQAAWDLILPVYFGDEKEPINPERLSAVVIQVKNKFRCKKVPQTNLYEPFFGGKKQLVVFLHLDLGDDRKQAEYSAQMLPPKRANGRTTPMPPPIEPFVFSLWVKGSDKNTFPVLKNHDLDSACALLLKVTLRGNPNSHERQICNRMDGYGSFFEFKQYEEHQKECLPRGEGEDEGEVEGCGASEGDEDVEMTQ
jgi:hypothetical protein